MRKNTRHLREMLPGLPVLYVYCALMTFRGDVDKTAALLMDEPPSDFSLKLSKLKKLLPKAKDRQVRDVLIASTGDMDEASKRLKNELALAEGTAIPLHNSATPNSIETETPSVTSTHTTTTTHVNGIVQSFNVSTKIHTTSAEKSKSATKPKTLSKSVVIDLTEEIEHEALAHSPLKQYLSPSLSPVKTEGQGTVGSPIKLESLDEKVDRPLELLPNANRNGCEAMLQVCDGDVSIAYNILANDTFSPLAEQVAPNKDDSRGSREQNDATATKEKGSEGKIAKLRECFPKASLIVCENALTARDRNTNAAFGWLESEYTPLRRLNTPNPATNTNSPVRKVETKEPGSQGSNLDNIADFFAKKLSASPVIDEENDREADPFYGYVSDGKVDSLFESLLRKVPRNACRKALEMNDGDGEGAHLTLSAEHGIFDDKESSSGQRRLCKRDGGPAVSPRARRERCRERAATPGYSTSRQKRKAESPVKVLPQALSANCSKIFKVSETDSI